MQLASLKALSLRLINFLIAKDKVAHFVIGVLGILALLLILAVHRATGIGPATAVTTTLLGAALEAYQRVRHEGTPSLLDAVATASPGWAFWLVSWLKG